MVYRCNFPENLPVLVALEHFERFSSRWLVKLFQGSRLPGRISITPKSRLCPGGITFSTRNTSKFDGLKTKKSNEEPGGSASSLVAVGGIEVSVAGIGVTVGGIGVSVERMRVSVGRISVDVVINGTDVALGAIAVEAPQALSNIMSIVSKNISRSDRNWFIALSPSHLS